MPNIFTPIRNGPILRWLSIPALTLMRRCMSLPMAKLSNEIPVENLMGPLCVIDIREKAASNNEAQVTSLMAELIRSHIANA